MPSTILCDELPLKPGTYRVMVVGKDVWERAAKQAAERGTLFSATAPGTPTDLATEDAFPDGEDLPTITAPPSVDDADTILLVFESRALDGSLPTTPRYRMAFYEKATD